MIGYVAKRFAYMVIMIVLVSFVAFFLVQLPPGDFVTSHVNELMRDGQQVSRQRVEALRELYGLDRPFIVQYFKWVGGLLRGNLGHSFAYDQPVARLIAGRLGLTVMLSGGTLLFTYLMAIPMGIYSARHQYSISDYGMSFIGFIGMATPNFILALVLMWFFNTSFGVSIGGLVSREFQGAPWSMAKFGNVLIHLPVPIIVIGTAGTARVIRTLRATMLDELRKQYVVTARSKGLEERRVILKYPTRIALNPLASNMSGVLVDIVSGSVITATVLNLPTLGPLLLDSLLKQDVYLSGAIILFQSIMVFVGTFLSDILLVALDPRIRLEK